MFREVLRDQPENLLDFAANYFDALLAKRKITGLVNFALFMVSSKALIKGTVVQKNKMPIKVRKM